MLIYVNNFIFEHKNIYVVISRNHTSGVARAVTACSISAKITSKVYKVNYNKMNNLDVKL